jgi:hypothetical protein
MDSDLRGLQAHLGRTKGNGAVEHNGKQLPRATVISLVEYGIKKGYKYLSELTDEDIETVINKK